MQTDAVCRGRPGDPESVELWHNNKWEQTETSGAGKATKIKEGGRRIIPPCAPPAPRSAEPPTHMLTLSRGRPKLRPRSANEWMSFQSHGNRDPPDLRPRTNRIFFLVMMREVEAPDKLGSIGNERINNELARCCLPSLERAGDGGRRPAPRRRRPPSPARSTCVSEPETCRFSFAPPFLPAG